MKNLIIIAILFAGCFFIPGTAESEPAAPTYRALYCSSCGFGNKKNDCVLCGKWVGGNGIPAFLCSSCGFGNKNNDCVKCGKWVGGSSVPALMCSSCGFGDKKNKCVKCGK